MWLWIYSAGTSFKTVIGKYFSILHHIFQQLGTPPDRLVCHSNKPEMCTVLLQRQTGSVILLRGGKKSAIPKQRPVYSLHILSKMSKVCLLVWPQKYSTDDLITTRYTELYPNTKKFGAVAELHLSLPGSHHGFPFLNRGLFCFCPPINSELPPGVKKSLSAHQVSYSDLGRPI